MGAGHSNSIVSYSEAVERLPEEWLEAIQLTFQEMSKHKDLSGKVSKERFKEFYGDKAIHTLGPIFNRLFDVLDTDGDGTVDYEEFLSGMFIFGRGTQEEKLKFFFKLYDVNGDGYLSKEEFTQMVQSAHNTELALGALLVEEDAQYTDLAQSVKNKKEDSKAKLKALVDQLFDEGDLNKDGYLTFEEFHEWAKTNLNVNQWLDAFLPAKIEKLREFDKVDEVKELASILVTKMRLDHNDTRYVNIGEDDRTLKYTGVGVDIRQSAGYQCGYVHTEEMIDTDLSPDFYFEVTFIDAGATAGNVIGFYPVDTRITGAPGWYNNSYGYHGDEGCRYHQMKKEQFKDGSRYVTREFGTGDTVGAGIKDTSLYFTRNGRRLEPAYTGVTGVFYPIV